MNICKKIYCIGAQNKIYGDTKGVCRITGEESVGVPFDSWVKDTFNDHDNLHDGTIISNEALFCFDESSDIIQKKVSKEKPQRFRTYSHIVKDGQWYCLTKADKRLMYELVTSGAEVVCLAESGQKHILFKHKDGMWQLEEMQTRPNIALLKKIHENASALIGLGFTQTEVISGDYASYKIMKVGIDVWKHHDNELKMFRGSQIFDFASFMFFDPNK